jgi:hypothetical protein
MYNAYMAHVAESGNVSELTRKEPLFPAVLDSINLMAESESSGVGVLWMNVLNGAPQFLKSWLEFESNEIPTLFMSLDRRSGVREFDSGYVTNVIGTGKKLYPGGNEMVAKEKVDLLISVVNNFCVRHVDYLTQLNALLSGAYDSGVEVSAPVDYVPPSGKLFELLSELTSVDVTRLLLQFMVTSGFSVKTDVYNYAARFPDVSFDTMTDNFDDYVTGVLSGLDQTLTQSDIEAVYGGSYLWPKSYLTMEINGVNTADSSVLSHANNRVGYSLNYAVDNYGLNINNSAFRADFQLDHDDRDKLRNFIKAAMKLYSGHKLNVFTEYTGGTVVNMTLPLWVVNRMRPVFVLLYNLELKGINTSLSSSAKAVISGLVS